MSLGSTILLPALYDIQHEVEKMDRNYKGCIKLDVLDKNSGSKTKVIDSKCAPRATVYNFISTLSNKLFQFNVLKKTIEGEKRTKFTIALVMLLLGLMIVITVFSVILAMVIWPTLFGKEREKDLTFFKLENIYFLVILFVVTVYALFVVITLFMRYNTILNTNYEVSNLFTSEPSVQYIISMMNMKDKKLGNKEINLSGTNPLLGYFIHEKKGLDVKYEYVPRISKGNTECLEKKKTFTFSESKKNPWKLTSDSLLNTQNLPCHVVSRENSAYVDPFVQTDNLTRNPELFKKKLQKFDIYGQYNRLSEAVIYFNSFLLKNQIQNNLIDDSAYASLLKDIVNILTLNQQLVTYDLHPISQQLKYFQDDKKINTTKENVFTKLNGKNYKIAYYDDANKTLYLFTEIDLKNMVFMYSTKEKGNFTVVNGTDEQINIAAKNVPKRSILEKHINVGNYNDNGFPDNSVSEASLDQTVYSILSIIDGTTEKAQPNNGKGVDYKDLFSQESYSLNDSPPISVFFLRLPIQSYIKQNQSTNMENTYKRMTGILVETILKRIIRIDPNGNIAFDEETRAKLKQNIYISIGENYKYIEGTLDDILSEIPFQIKKYVKEKNELDENYDPTDPKHKYVTVEIFQEKMANMTQNEFMNTFLYNLEVIRNSSVGLKYMYDKYNHSYEVSEKNRIIFEFTFFMIVIIGFFELIRFCMHKGFSFKCMEIDFREREMKIREQTEPTCDDTEKEYREKREKRKLELHKIETEKNIHISKIVLHCAIFFAIYAVLCSFVYAWKEHSKTVQQYNKYIIENNGSNALKASEQLFTFFSNSILHEGLFVKINSEKYFETYTGDVDEIYPLIRDNSIVNDDVKISYPTIMDFKPQHNTLIEMLESCALCNSLVNNKSGELPFPMFEVAMEAFLIIVLIFILAFIFIKFRPIKHFQNLQHWHKLKEFIDRDIEVTPESFGFECKDDTLSKVKTYNAFKYIVAIVLILFGFIFALILFRNTSLFTSSLYSSNLFQKMQCYK